MKLGHAAFATTIFVLLVPGTVVLLVPWLLTGWEWNEPFFGPELLRWLGVGLIVAGVPFLLEAIARFAWSGRGTPAPILPTEKLVVTGSYRYVRNPMYVAVVSTVVGQGLLLGHRAVLIYAVVLAVVFHLFVYFYEEPTLRRQFGEQYDDYCRAVGRWMPRLRPWTPA